MTDPELKPLLAQAGLAGPVTRLTPLAGDASTRRYLRLFLPSGETAILAEYPPEGADAAGFLQRQQELDAAGIRVPRLLGVSRDRRRVLQEDLGDETLQERLGRRGEEAFRQFYPQAVRMLARIQTLAPDEPGPRLDPERLRWELDLFHRHTLVELLGAQLASAGQAVLEDLYGLLAERAGAGPWVLCHRDFHSRNLMVAAGELVLIDFQDAMPGHPGYDLVSLTRDAYVRLSLERRSRLGRWLVREIGQARPENLPACAAQRALKAAGTFGMQVVLKGNRSYLPYLPGVLRAALEELRRVPGAGQGRALLQEHLPRRWID